MPDIASISAAISKVKTAISITKDIDGVDQSLEKSELKLKIVELRETLVKAKNELLEVQKTIWEKDDKIQELEQLLENFPDEPEVLENEQKEILKILAGNNGFEYSQTIEQSIKLARVTLSYYLNDLEKLEYIKKYRANIAQPFGYKLTERGTAFVIENNLT